MGCKIVRYWVYKVKASRLFMFCLFTNAPIPSHPTTPQPPQPPSLTHTTHTTQHHPPTPTNLPHSPQNTAIPTPLTVFSHHPNLQECTTCPPTTPSSSPSSSAPSSPSASPTGSTAPAAAPSTPSFSCCRSSARGKRVRRLGLLRFEQGRVGCSGGGDIREVHFIACLELFLVG